MSAPARFRQVDLERALKAAKKCGYEDVRVRVTPGGEMDIFVGKAANDELPPIELD